MLERPSDEPTAKYYSRTISKLFDSVLKTSKSTKKIKSRKSKLLTHRPKIIEGKRKISKIDSKQSSSGKDYKIESKHSSAVKDYNIESKENRPLQINSMNNSRVSRYYQTQRQIQEDEDLLDELQSKA
jgi:hypothetical protein